MDKDLTRFKDRFAGYTELRVQENSSVGIAVVDGTVMGNSQDSSGGVSARVFKNGAWGFASTPDLADGSIQSVIRTASGNAEFMDSKLKHPAPQAACGQRRIFQLFWDESSEKKPKRANRFCPRARWIYPGRVPRHQLENIVAAQSRYGKIPSYFRRFGLLLSYTPDFMLRHDVCGKRRRYL